MANVIFDGNAPGELCVEAPDGNITTKGWSTHSSMYDGPIPVPVIPGDYDVNLQAGELYQTLRVRGAGK